MPVTSRKLLVANISGQGKKAPNNLRYDHVKRQIININCECKPISCNGTFPTGQLFGDAICNETTCYSSLLPS